MSDNIDGCVEELDRYEDAWSELIERARQMKLCEAGGHPFPDIGGVPNGLNNVLVQCSGCGALYERRPNSEELKLYTDTMKMEFRGSRV